MPPKQRQKSQPKKRVSFSRKRSLSRPPQPKRPRNRQRKSNQGKVIRAPNTVFAQRPVIGPPQYKDRSATGVTVSHVEFVGYITPSSNPFALIASFALNPGIQATFPWLWQIAINYEKYRFIELVFVFKASASTNTQGSIVAYFDYDASDLPPTSAFTANNGMYGGESPVWASLNVPMDCSAKYNPVKLRNVRQQPLTANLDISLWDQGNLFVTSNNSTSAGGVCGSIYLQYTVLLEIPQVQTLPFSYSSSAQITSPGPTLYSVNPITVGALPLTFASVSSIAFNRLGTYLLTIVCTAAAGLTAGAAVVNTAASTVQLSQKLNYATTATLASALFLITVSVIGQIFSAPVIGGVALTSGITTIAPVYPLFT